MILGAFYESGPRPSPLSPNAGERGNCGHRIVDRETTQEEYHV